MTLSYKPIFIGAYLFLLSLIELSGQFGLRLKYNDANFENWENALKSNFGDIENLYSPGYEVGADYWFRLKKKRIEFMPELAYSFAKTNYSNSTIDYVKFNAFSFNFHTHIYALDMENDCDCPTFSKQGPGINKGLFFHFTPGVSMVNAEAAMRPESSLMLPHKVSNALMLRAGLGMGLDIGLSNLMTLTPIISYYFQSGITWKGLALNGSTNADVAVNPNMLQLSLRLGFRPDYNKRSFRR